MVGFLKALSTALPAAVAVATAATVSSSTSSSSRSLHISHPLSFPSSLRVASISRPLDAVRNLGPPMATAVQMDAPATEKTSDQQQQQLGGGALPDLLTEFMVDMKCEGCVSAVKDNLLKLEGVKSIDVDLSNQVVRVCGSLPVKTMLDALTGTGRKARVIGQGSPDAVVEFKGPVIYGVVRLAQVNMELARIEASFSGLSPGKHGWSINKFGDLTRGVASTGEIFNTGNQDSEKPLGDLGTIEALETGEAHFSGAKEKLRVADLIGRSIAIYETEDKQDSGISAAVIARSAGVGENYKKICTCDGVTIWESN